MDKEKTNPKSNSTPAPKKTGVGVSCATKSKRGPGRPKASINWKKVDNYLKAGCIGTGIADILGIAPITLYRACESEHKVNFDAYAQQKREVGDNLLHAKQFEVALRGDKTMLVWLGKQRLGQKDKIEQAVEAKVTTEAIIKGISKEQAAEILADEN